MVDFRYPFPCVINLDSLRCVFLGSCLKKNFAPPLLYAFERYAFTQMQLIMHIVWCTVCVKTEGAVHPQISTILYVIYECTRRMPCVMIINISPTGRATKTKDVSMESGGLTSCTRNYLRRRNSEKNDAFMMQTRACRGFFLGGRQKGGPPSTQPQPLGLGLPRARNFLIFNLFKRVFKSLFNAFVVIQAIHV